MLQKVTVLFALLFSSIVIAKPVPDISVKDLDNLMKSKKVVVFDANGTKTRTNMGVIPGARLLSSYDNYSLSELPKNKAQKIVFYCANTMCSAAPKAAAKAIKAGYTNVAHLSVGIAGWNKEFKSTK